MQVCFVYTYDASIEGCFHCLPMYCPILLTCQMRTDYTVSAHDISNFDKYSVVFVRCTDNNQQLEVIAQWSKAQISNLVVVTD